MTTGDCACEPEAMLAETLKYLQDHDYTRDRAAGRKDLLFEDCDIEDDMMGRDCADVCRSGACRVCVYFIWID